MDAPSTFLKKKKLLYAQASSMVKVGDGLNRPITVSRAIRLLVLGEPQGSKISVSAYVDDVMIFIIHSQDRKTPSKVLQVHQKASSAKGTWVRVRPYGWVVFLS